MSCSTPLSLQLSARYKSFVLLLSDTAVYHKDCKREVEALTSAEEGTQPLFSLLITINRH